MIDVNFGDADARDGPLKDSDFDGIVHLGAQAGIRYSLKSSRTHVHSNLVGHLNIVELACHRGVGHLF